MNPRLIIPCLLAFAAPVVAFAADPAVEAGHGGHAADHAAEASPMDFSLIQFFSAIVVFCIVFAVLAKVAWPKILKGLDDRSAKIRSEIYAAEQARQEAKKAQDQYAKELAEARSEAARLIEQTKAEQVRMAAEMKVKAEAELNVLREQAKQSIEAAKRAALNEIYVEAANLSTTIASRILQREVNPADQQRLVDDTLREFAKSRN